MITATSMDVPASREPDLGVWPVRLVHALMIVVVARDEYGSRSNAISRYPWTETIHAGHETEVLDPGVDEADVCRHPGEENNRKKEERKQVEGVAELSRLGDQGQSDDGGGHNGQKDVGSTIGRAVCDLPQAGSSARSRGSARAQPQGRRGGEKKVASADRACIQFFARQSSPRTAQPAGGLTTHSAGSRVAACMRGSVPATARRRKDHLDGYVRDHP